MAGGFVFVVGPSGAGKDTLIRLARERLAGDPCFHFARRLVTRPASAHEDHDTIDAESFVRDADAGRFALCWRAHGLGYAIPGAAREAARMGRVVVCNGSRGALDEARRLLCGLSVVEITASEAVLARRLAARARAEDGPLAARLDRSRALAPIRADLAIVNEGAPDAAAERLVSFLIAKAKARSAAPCAGLD